MFGAILRHGHCNDAALIAATFHFHVHIYDVVFFFGVFWVHSSRIDASAL